MATIDLQKKTVKIILEKKETDDSESSSRIGSGYYRFNANFIQ